MADQHKIQNTSEATAARQRAIRTELATVPLLKELGQPGLSPHERAEKKREIDRLREQYRREMAPVEAFYRELAPKLKEAEEIFERKDPKVDRLREELTRVLERSGEHERSEIDRIRGEFERRREELARKSQ